MAGKSRDEAKVSYPGLLNDVLFKIVFGGSQNEAVLRHLLNALLNLTGGDKIVKVEILSPSPEKFYFDDKGPVLDLKAKDEKGTHYNVEVQLRATDLDYIKRSLYYTTKLYSDQLKSGHDYPMLARSVSISILDFVLFPEREPLHSTFTLWEQSQGFQLTDDLELHYIELPKFTPDKPKSVQTRFEKWLYLLKFSDLYHTRELPDNIKDEEGIQMAIDSMRKAYARDDIRAYIEAQEKGDRDRASIAAATRRRIEEADQKLKEADRLRKETDQLRKETDQLRKETDQLRKETDRRLKEADQLRKETDRRLKEADQQRKETDRRLKEADQQRKEADQQLKEAGQQAKEAQQRAEQAEQRATRLATHLRELGLDPDQVTG